MPVKNAIILSAGKGTRMGQMGEVLAKPVWPFFGKTLLELQISFLASRFGIENFYVNSHHLSEQLNFLKDRSNIKIVHEPTLLDQGGGVLNICERYNLWNTPLLVNNADQFYFFDKRHFENAIKALKDNDCILFGLNVKTKDKYNKINFDQSKTFSGVTQNKEVQSLTHVTYSGMSLTKVSKTIFKNEPSKFFDTIAKVGRHKVKVEDVLDGEYYDFGKLNEYYEICFETKRLMEKRISNKLIELLKSEDIEIATNKEEGLNFSSNKNSLISKNKILLDQGELDLIRGEVVAILRNPDKP